jgi:hypothetical protein
MVAAGACATASFAGDPFQRIQKRSAGELPARLGTYYEDKVPDTLDLAERGKLGINYFSGILEPKLDFEMYFSCNFRQYSTATLWTHITSLGACQEKAMEAMAMERLMSGSQQGLAEESRMVQLLASLQGDDGLLWLPAKTARKPWLGNEPLAMVHGQGRFLRAMLAWYQYTGDPIWKNRIDKLVDGLDRLMVVHKDDYAYFPIKGYYPGEYLRSCYTKRGWADTSEPANEKAGEEGSLFNHQAHIAGCLASWHGLSGNEQAIRLSAELVRFLIKPQFWADYKGGDYPGVAGAQHAHYTGHPCGHLNVLRAILDYAVVANDARLKQFARDGYEWTRQKVFSRIGWVGDDQGCNGGRLLGLAVKLSYLDPA